MKVSCVGSLSVLLPVCLLLSPACWTHPLMGLRGPDGGAESTSILVALALGGRGIASGGYALGGGVTGLTEDGLTLQNNGADDLTLNAGASAFSFPTPLADGASYDVAVRTHPPTLYCWIANGSGVIAGGPISNVGVTCAPAVTTGQVQSFSRIGAGEGGFAGALDGNDFFGRSLAAMGDLDGDGIGDIAAGAAGDDDGGAARGAVWLLYLNADGGVKSQRKISATQGGFTGTLTNGASFGWSVARPGDVDGDGVADLAVGAPGDDNLLTNHGAVWVLFLNSDGTVKAQQKISGTQGGFVSDVNANDQFGEAVAGPGDIDGDGVPDLVVGAPRHDHTGNNLGAIWVLLLNANGTVKAQQKISAGLGGFGALADFDSLGASIAGLGDFNGDLVPDIAVGAPGDDAGFGDAGALWLLYLTPTGAVTGFQKISAVPGVAGGDNLGSSLAAAGDLDRNGVPDLIAGATGDEGNGSDRGAAWVLFLNADGSLKAQHEIADGVGGFSGLLEDFRSFGEAVASPGDLNGDRVPDLVIGINGGLDPGHIWTLFLEPDS